MNRLKEIREQAQPKISRNKLAARAGVDGQTIYRLENGARPQLTTAYALALALTEMTGEEVRVEDIFPVQTEASA